MTEFNPETTLALKKALGREITPLEQAQELWFKTFVYRFYCSIRYSIKWFLEYVDSVCAYSRLRRGSYEFDYTFVLKLLKFSLARLRGHIEKGFHKDRYKDAKKIRVCELLCDRLISNGYTDTEEKEYYELSRRYGGGVFPSRRPPRRIEEKLLKLANIIVEKEERMREQDLSLLFRLLRRHLITWWD